MNLDESAQFSTIDAQSMSAWITGQPSDLEAAWALGQSLPLEPLSGGRVSRVVIAGVGTAAIAGEMLAGLVADTCNLPILVQRGYELPAFADGQSTLIILLDHSGDNEESYSTLELADARGTKILVLTSGGPLTDYTAHSNSGVLVWRYAHAGPARTALAWQLGLLCAFVSRMGWVSDLGADVAEAVQVLRTQQPEIDLTVPAIKNPAKRQAGQMLERIPYLYGGGIMAPVARHWKNQLNEHAKVMAIADELPELNHNTLSGLGMLPNGLRLAAVCLASPTLDHPRVRLRQTLTRGVLMMEGVVPDTYTARGESALAQVMSAVQYADFTSYYVALALDIDPSQTPALDEVRGRLSR